MSVGAKLRHAPNLADCNSSTLLQRHSKICWSVYAPVAAEWKLWNLPPPPFQKKYVCMRSVTWTAVTTMNIFQESVSVTKNVYLAWRMILICKRLPHKYHPFMTVPRPKQLLDHPSRQRLQFVQSTAHWDMSQQVWLWNKFFCSRSGFLPSVLFQKHFTISFILIVVLSEGQAGDYWLTKQKKSLFVSGSFGLKVTWWSKNLCVPDDYSKSSVYSNNPHTVDELKMAITEYIRNVDRAILNTVFENTVRRVNKCLGTGGGHFEYYLYLSVL